MRWKGIADLSAWMMATHNWILGLGTEKRKIRSSGVRREIRISTQDGMSILRGNPMEPVQKYVSHSF